MKPQNQVTMISYKYMKFKYQEAYICKKTINKKNKNKVKGYAMIWYRGGKHTNK